MRLARRGISLVEAVMGIIMFLVIFVGALKLYTESNLPQQGMIRDFAIALNICERFINSLRNDILEGSPPPAPGSEQDVTEAVLDHPAVQDYLKIFAGGVGKESTDLVANFRTWLTVKEESAGFYRLSLRFAWGQRTRHTFTLQSLVYRR